MASQAELLATAKLFIPSQFLTLCSDAHIMAFLNMTLAEANNKPPLTGYVLDNMPTTWNMLIVFGSTVYSTLFMQASYTLNDFSYSDGGLSLNIDRTAKMSVPLANQLNLWQKQLEDMKRVEMLRVPVHVLATNHFGVLFSQMITSLFPGQTFR